MRRGLPIDPTGSTNAALLPRDRDRAVLDAFKGLVGHGVDDPSGSGALAGPSDALSGLVEGEFVTAWRCLPAVAARFADYPDAIDERLRVALATGGISRPYVHQAEAMAHVLGGRHVVTVTPTASGKLLKCAFYYRSGVFRASVRNS